MSDLTALTFETDDKPWTRRGGRRPTPVPENLQNAVQSSYDSSAPIRMVVPEESVEEVKKLLKLHGGRMNPAVTVETATDSGPRKGTVVLRFQARVRKQDKK